MFAVRGVLEARAASCGWVVVLFCVSVAGAWAQTSPDVETPPSTSPPDATAPETTTPTQPGVVTLPTIRVSPSRPRANEKPAQTAEQSTQAPPSPYDTGDPNVAEGASAQPSAASQLTVSGAQVNAVPFSR